MPDWFTLYGFCGRFNLVPNATRLAALQHNVDFLDTFRYLWYPADKVIAAQLFFWGRGFKTNFLMVGKSLIVISFTISFDWKLSGELIAWGVILNIIDKTSQELTYHDCAAPQCWPECSNRFQALESRVNHRRCLSVLWERWQQQYFRLAICASLGKWHWIVHSNCWGNDTLKIWVQILEAFSRTWSNISKVAKKQISLFTLDLKSTVEKSQV